MGDPAAKPDRLISLDAYRGFIMLAMASGGLGFAAMAQKDGFSDSPLWQALAFQFDHVPWVGCSFWDLIQPSFMFMVGVALPYSYASRKARGESERRVFAHTVLRAVVLILLGIFFVGNSGTYFAGLEYVSASLSALIVYMYPARAVDAARVIMLSSGGQYSGHADFINAWNEQGLTKLVRGCLDNGHVLPTLDPTQQYNHC